MMQPKKGDVVRFVAQPEIVLGTVDHIDTSWPSIVHVRTPEGEWTSFIWTFRDGPNNHFTWGSK